MNRFPIQPYTFEKLAEPFNSGDNRYYRTNSGKKYLSVTSLLKLLNKDAIAKWRKRVGEKEANRRTKHGSTRGTFVHKMAEKYLLGDDDYEEGRSPFVIDVFRSIKPVIDKNVNIIHNTEFGLYSDRLKLAGTADLLVTWNKALTLLDFKTSDKPKKEEWIKNYFWQCTIYCLCIYERIGLIVPNIALVIGVENELPQVFVKKAADYVDPVLTFIKAHHLTQKQ